jgi:3-deoxy-D-manno-octulosonic-acid transferase
LSRVAVQNETYAARFRALGVPENRIVITGTMKWDTAQIADVVPGSESLASEFGIDRERPLVVAGSTAPGEHDLFARSLPDDAQLLCAPRKPEWFDRAAAELPGCARRSRQQRGSATGRFLLDTIGELRAAYALADVVVIGRSFGNLHGSDMMEPIALGKAVIVGPAVTDFQDIVEALLAGGGIMQVNADGLANALWELLNGADRRATMAARGRDVIRQHQGATEQTARLLLDILASPRNVASKKSSSQR